MSDGRVADASAPSLVIEASTYRATVAVVRGPTVLTRAPVAMRGEHEERLMPAVAEALATADLAVSDLGRVICGAGPGSFTSLRIAAAIAKGLCVGGTGRGGPRLAAVSSLLLIVAGALDRLAPGSYWVSSDALRGERYATLVVVDGLGAPPPTLHAGARGEGHIGDAADSVEHPRRISWHGQWSRLTTTELLERSRRDGATVIGPDEAKPVWPDAGGVTQLWDQIMDVDPVSWEPDYGRLAEAEVRRAALLASE